MEKYVMINLKKFNEINSQVPPPHQKDMYEGIVEILLMVNDEKNRMDIANKMMSKFRKEGVVFNKLKFIKDCKL